MARMRGFLWLMAGLIMALMAGFVAYQSLSRVTTAPEQDESGFGPMVQVVVAERAVAIRTALSAEDLSVHDVPVASAPEGAARSIDDVVGKLTLVDLYPGEALLLQRLVEPNLSAANGRTSLVMVEDQVLVAVPAQDLMGKIGVLKRGDHVDIHFSLPFPANRGPGNAGDNDDEQATFGLLQNLIVADFVGGEVAARGVTEGLAGAEGGEASMVNPQAILLTVNAQDSLVLKYLIDAGGTLDLVLRSPGMERPFDTDPVDVDYLIDRYDIPTQVGR